MDLRRLRRSTPFSHFRILYMVFAPPFCRFRFAFYMLPIFALSRFRTSHFIRVQNSGHLFEGGHTLREPHGKNIGQSPLGPTVAAYDVGLHGLGNPAMCNFCSLLFETIHRNCRNRFCIEGIPKINNSLHKCICHASDVNA